MDIDQLRYFTVIAKHQNLSKAQEELYVAQPALSTSLSRLERQLGVALFDRYKGRLYLNRYGKIFLEYAAQICRISEEARAALQRERERNENSLLLGMVDWGFAPGLISEFAASCPEVVVNVSQISLANTDLNACLERYDILVCPFPMALNNAECIPLLRDELFLAVAASHRFHGREYAALSDLEDEVVLCPGFQMHFGPFVSNLLERSKVYPKRMEGCMAENLAELLEVKNAVAVLVKGVRRRMGACENVHFLPLRPAIYRESGLAFSQKRELSPAAARFLKFAKEYCSSHENGVFQ